MFDVTMFNSFDCVSKYDSVITRVICVSQLQCLAPVQLCVQQPNFPQLILSAHTIVHSWKWVQKYYYYVQLEIVEILRHAASGAMRQLNNRIRIDITNNEPRPCLTTCIT